MNVSLEPQLAEIRKRFQENAFSQLLETELLLVSPEEIQIGLLLQPKHLQNVGFAHGGLLATMADVVMGFAAVAKSRDGQHVLTADLRISYLNPGIGPYIWARGFAIKAGRRLVFTEAEIFNSLEKPVRIAKASATMAIVEATELKR
jgi:uncharacterized protein (TIGR00369 family)